MCSAIFDLLLTIKSVLLMKAKPAIAQCSFDIAYMNVATNPLECMISNSGELMAAHICGPAPLPRPIPTHQHWVHSKYVCKCVYKKFLMSVVILTQRF